MSKIVISDRIVVDGAPVGFIHRERPVNADDSGWRALAGDEDAAAMGDATRHGAYDLGELVGRDDAILPLLGAEIGSAFERGPDGEFRRLGPNEWKVRQDA